MAQKTFCDICGEEMIKSPRATTMIKDNIQFTVLAHRISTPHLDQADVCKPCAELAVFLALRDKLALADDSEENESAEKDPYTLISEEITHVQLRAE